MTEGNRVAPLAFIHENLWAILAAAGAAYGGYLTGMTTVNHRLSTLEQSVGKLETKLELLAPRVERLDVQAEMARDERLKGPE